MANTTDNEFPTQERDKLEGNDKKIVELYEKGKNFYFIAGEVYGFIGDEAVEKVRQVLQANGYLDSAHRDPETRLIEE